MEEIIFYRFESGTCPVEEFLSSLTAKKKKKVLFVLQLVEELELVPREYFKKLSGTDDIWEIRVQHGNNIFRLLGFLDGEDLVLNHAFTKKTQKTPKQEIRRAERRKQEYQRRKQ